MPTSTPELGGPAHTHTHTHTHSGGPYVLGTVEEDLAVHRTVPP